MTWTWHKPGDEANSLFTREINCHEGLTEYTDLPHLIRPPDQAINPISTIHLVIDFYDNWPDLTSISSSHDQIIAQNTAGSAKM